MRISRRGFIAGAASTLASAHARAAAGHRPRIAALTTIFHKYSHSEHIVDRFLEGYGWEGRHHRPAMDVVSLYVEQVGQERPQPGAGSAASRGEDLSRRSPRP